MVSGTPGVLLSRLVTLVSPLGEKELCDEGLSSRLFHFTFTNLHLTNHEDSRGSDTGHWTLSWGFGSVRLVKTRTVCACHMPFHMPSNMTSSVSLL